MSDNAIQVVGVRKAFGSVPPISVTVNGARFRTSGGAALAVAVGDVWQPLLWAAGIGLVSIPAVPPGGLSAALSRPATHCHGLDCLEARAAQ